MSDKSLVTSFLNDFQVKLNIWGVLFIDREKNNQALTELEIKPIQREEILKKLELSDYCKGPLEESQYGGNEMWVFGRELKGKEIYIKISVGIKSEKVLCISFHIAEYPMKYKFK